MDLLDRILISIDAFKDAWSRNNKKHIDDYYQIVSPVDDYTFKMNDGSMLSFISLNGCGKMLSDKEKMTISKKLSTEFSSFFKNSGYSMQIVDCSDPQLTRRKVEKSINPSLEELNNIGITAKLFTSDYVDFIVKNSVWKAQYIILRTDALSLDNKKIHQKELNEDELKKNQLKTEFIVDAMNTKIENQAVFISDREKEIYKNQRNYLKTVMSVLNKNGFLVEVLGVVKSIVNQREIINGIDTDKGWEPSFGNVFIEKNNQSDVSKQVKVQCDNVCEQVCFQGLTEENLPIDVLKLGSRYITTLSMVIPQSNAKELKSYTYLLDRIPKEIGYVYSVNMQSDPFSKSSYKVEQVYTAISLIYPFTDNFNIKNERDKIKKLHDNDVDLSSFVEMTITLHSDNLDQLEENKRLVLGILDSWGAAKFRLVEMDKVSGFFDTMPGCSVESSLKQVLESVACTFYQSPLFMNGKPYSSGYLHFFTDNDEPYPFEEQSSKNINFNSYYSGESGSGKSTLLSLFNLALIAKPKANPALKGEMPLQVNVDFGKTSFSLNDSLQMFIDEDKSHLFYSHEMTTNKESAYNVHDLPFGLTKPTMRHKLMLSRFLSILIGGIKENDNGTFAVKHTEVETMISYLVDVVYEYFDEKNDPKEFQLAEFKEPNILKTFKKLNINPLHKTYYELSDMIMQKMGNKGYLIASVIRRYAVPRLSDYTIVLSTRSELADKYRKTSMTNGQSLFDYFVQRIGEIANEYPCLNRVTKLNIDRARLISIDIKNVCGTDNYRKAVFGSMMLLLFLVKKENSEESSDLLNGVKDLYLPILKRIDLTNKFLPATLNIEEAHILMTLFDKELNDNQRQNRKANWGIRSFSQRLIDPSDDFFYLCSSVFISSNEASDLNKPRFNEMGLSQKERSVIKTDLTDKITDFFAYIKTKNAGSDKGFRIGMKLHAFFPAGFIWSTNSDQTDRNFKNMALKTFGAHKGTELLCNYFPAGKVKHYFESEKLKEYSLKNGYNNVSDMLIGEMKKQDNPSDTLRRLL